MLIKSAKEVGEELTAKHRDIATEQYRRSVRPIYAGNERQEIEQIASCILMKFGSSNYLLTAAHVVDHASYTTIYIGADVPLPITGTFTLTEAGNSRNNDQYDFAFLKLSADLESALANYQFVDIEDCSSKDDFPKTSTFLAMGYPNTRNRNIDRGNGSIHPTLFRYTAHAGSKSQLAPNWKTDGSDHVFLFFGKHSRDAAGRKVSSTHPQGMSGGLLINLGSLATPEILTGATSPRPQIAGLLTEGSRRSGRIVATKLGAIKEAIKRSEAKEVSERIERLLCNQGKSLK